MLHSARSLACLLALATLLPSCAKESENDLSGYYPVFQYEVETVLSALKRAPLDVAPGVSTADADQVGLIAMAASPRSSAGQKVGQCTGFLIDQNIVATNSHCMTAEVMRNADCGESLGIKFRSPDAEGKTLYSCKRVLKKSTLKEEEIDQADWAFFEIQAPSRRTLRVARLGLPDELRVRSVRVDPKGNGLIGGTITSAECNTAQGSALNPHYVANFSTTGLAMGCSARQGNSGSPVLNVATGEVVGILQAYLTDKYMKIVNKQLSPLGLSFPATPPDHFIFTNLSCVEEARGTFTLNQAACAADRQKTLVDSIGESHEKNLQESLAQEGSVWERSLPPVALYTISMGQMTDGFRAKPLCLRPLRDWPAGVLEGKTSEGFLRSTDTYRVSFDEALKVKPQFALDPAMRIAKNIRLLTSRESIQYTFTFRGEGGEITAVSFKTKRYGFVDEQPVEGLDWCSPEALARGNVADTSPRASRP